MEQRTLFVSDIHLSESRNEIVTAFFSFLEEQVEGAAALYILGDLFDYWAGDDIETPLTEALGERLSHLALAGTAIYFQHGNRDFALGKRYAERYNIELIPPFYRPKEYPEALLMHGDELCIDDKRYQRYKRIIRNPFLLTLLRHLPKKYRLGLAEKIRAKSARQSERSIIVDINEAYTVQIFEQYRCEVIIHGHTHRPARHQMRNGVRYVLSDWDQTGDYLQYRAGQLTRHQIKI